VRGEDNTNTATIERMIQRRTRTRRQRRSTRRVGTHPHVPAVRALEVLKAILRGLGGGENL